MISFPYELKPIVTSGLIQIRTFIMETNTKMMVIGIVCGLLGVLIIAVLILLIYIFLYRKRRYIWKKPGSDESPKLRRPPPIILHTHFATFQGANEGTDAVDGVERHHGNNCQPNGTATSSLERDTQGCINHAAVFDEGKSPTLTPGVISNGKVPGLSPDTTSPTPSATRVSYGLTSLENPYATIGPDLQVAETLPQTAASQRVAVVSPTALPGLQRSSYFGGDTSHYQLVDDESVGQHVHVVGPNAQEDETSGHYQRVDELFSDNERVIAKPTPPVKPTPQEKARILGKNPTPPSKPLTAPKPEGLRGTIITDSETQGEKQLKSRSLPYKVGPRGDVYGIVDKSGTLNQCGDRSQVKYPRSLSKV